MCTIIDWDCIIVDEVHRIKEVKSKITIALKSLKCRTRIGLTGTLVQNKYNDLWCILDWANPSCLGTIQRQACEIISNQSSMTNVHIL